MLYRSMIGRFWLGKLTAARTAFVVLTAQPARVR
jgi:hypothetical protein